MENKKKNNYLGDVASKTQKYGERKESAQRKDNFNKS